MREDENVTIRVTGGKKSTCELKIVIDKSLFLFKKENTSEAGLT